MIPDSHHGMAADIGLTFHGQRHESGAHDDRAVERPEDADEKTLLWGAKIPIIKVKIVAYAPVS